MVSFAQFLRAYQPNPLMKKLILLSSFFFLAHTTWAQQELSAEEGIFIDFGESSPMFSLMATDIFGEEFYLPEIDLFNPEYKKEVNMVALMERERRIKERKVDFDSPLLSRSRESGTFKISDNVHLYSRDSNYDPYTGKKKNAVYEEMRPYLFNDVYRGYYTRRSSFYNPYFR